VEGTAGLIARFMMYVRDHGSSILVEVLVNFVLPFAIYNYAESSLGPVRALFASSVPPILWSLVEFARHRRLDALSLLVVSGIVLSLLAMLGGGGIRFLQLREKLVTGAIGLVFVGSSASRWSTNWRARRCGASRKPRRSSSNRSRFTPDSAGR
jgi:hypothetical protein